MFWRIALFVVVSFIERAFYDPPRGPAAADLKDLAAPKSNEGDPIVDGAGTFWVFDAHVAWQGDKRSQGIYKKGGKK